MKVIIIGCGAAGATAAQFARKNDRDAEIKIFEKGVYPEYSKCALPFVVSGELSPESIIEFSEDWFRKADIDLHLNTPVSAIDFENKVIETSDGKEEYDSLIIATGASPFSPVKTEGKTYFLRNMDDAIAIKKEAKNADSAIIIGAGLIGLEAAEALVKRGIDVTVVEFLPEILLTMVDDDVAKIVRGKIEEKVKFLLNNRVTEIRDKGNHMEVTASDEHGKKSILQGDFVIIATGNRSNVQLTKRLVGEKGIAVDERCETSIKGVYAAGDCTQYRDILGNIIPVGLGSVAVRQGKVAGANAVGGDEKLMPLVNARTTKIFGIEIAAVGPLRRSISFKPVIGKFRGKALPEYMGDMGENIFIKVYADSNGKIIGAQAAGHEAAQRINKFALAIHHGLTLERFLKAETAYAPAVAPVFDASTIACEIAKRKLK
ncbi:MAG: NAD(FAD)-dependent dehydrogenase [Thermoplasmata archaeon]|nr:MAG: NAD(FAD)-dependent dehydrogenase [Thermoplasmata archaeon]